MTGSPRILLVEDEEAIADAVLFGLSNEGFEVDAVHDGQAAVAADVDDYDLVVLDVRLPKLSGLEVCRRLRERSAVPILMLTALAGEGDRVLGLEIGADDYVTKPFSLPELTARVRAILRRTQLDRGGAPTTLEIGGLQLDLLEQSARVDGRRVELTPSEFRLLGLLATEPERAFSRRELVEHLWRSTHTADERTCDVHVKNLRRKIERDPSRPQRLVTVRGVGYMLRRVKTSPRERIVPSRGGS